MNEILRIKKLLEDESFVKKELDRLRKKEEEKMKRLEELFGVRIPRTAKELIEHLRLLNIRRFYTDEELKEAKLLSMKIRNVRVEVIDPFPCEWILFEIDGVTFGVSGNGVMCSLCEDNCVHELALVFWLEDRGWKFWKLGR